MRHPCRCVSAGIILATAACASPATQPGTGAAGGGGTIGAGGSGGTGGPGGGNGGTAGGRAGAGGACRLELDGRRAGHRRRRRRGRFHRSGRRDEHGWRRGRGRSRRGPLAGPGAAASPAAEARSGLAAAAVAGAVGHGRHLHLAKRRRLVRDLHSRHVGLHPFGRSKRSIQVPGGGWLKQGINASSGTYATQITVPDSGGPQTTLIEFGAVNFQATLSVDGKEVGTNTTSFTPSVFDVTKFVTPGQAARHLRARQGRPRRSRRTASRAFPTRPAGRRTSPQGIFRSALLRVYPDVYISDAFVRTSVTDDTLTYDVSITNTGTDQPAGHAVGRARLVELRRPRVPRHSRHDRHGGAGHHHDDDHRPDQVGPRHELVLVAERPVPVRLHGPPPQLDPRR